jgi:regulatory protein
MKITGLEPQVRDSERVNVFVDGKFLLGVNAALVYKLELTVGQELQPEQLEQLRYEETLQQAVDRAYNYLSYRPRSRTEVRRYLQQKQTPPEIIEDALARLDRYDLVNDRAFAAFWIENREQFSPRGGRALKSELRMKGVEREVIDELVNEEQDETLALQAARKKAESLARNPQIDFAAFRDRIGPFLLRRGFSYEIVKRAVRALWQELKTDAPEDEA